MIVALSTSSPESSVALIEPSGAVRWAANENAPGAASEACLRLLEHALRETGLSLNTTSLFVADVGPGSFTGVRVGVMMAKTFAWNFGVHCAAVDAFDLIDLNRAVAIPAGKLEYLLRLPGSEVARVRDLPGMTSGYGFSELTCFPSAANVQYLTDQLVPVSPMELVPHYFAEPSISTPKRPLSRIPF